MSTKPETLNINSPYMKLLATMFLIGGAWARLEYKMNELSDRTLKKIDEHIISDRFEKQIIESKIASLERKLDNATEYIQDYSPKEFVRPSETRIESGKKRKQF
jgi:lysyl-tRNA synthetase class I